MLRKVMLLGAMLAMALVAAAPALAVSPHFISASGALNTNGSLTVNFKEAGLGTNQNIKYTLSAQNKTTVAGPVSASGTVNSGKNGNVTSSLTVSPPPSDISCPKGQTLQLAEVSYTNLVLKDTTNNITAPLAGTFESGCLLPNVRGACD
jgi:hypothetical protein